MNRFTYHYKQIVSYDLITKFNYKNSFHIPEIESISVNLSSVTLAFEKKKNHTFFISTRINFWSKR